MGSCAKNPFAVAARLSRARVHVAASTDMLEAYLAYSSVPNMTGLSHSQPSGQDW